MEFLKKIKFEYLLLSFIVLMSLIYFEYSLSHLPITFPDQSQNYPEDYYVPAWIDQLKKSELNDKDVEALLLRIKSDIKLEKSKVRILIGQYRDKFILNGKLVVLGPLDYKAGTPDFYILIDDNFYTKLDKSEIMALIAHEMGHATQKFNPFEEINVETLSRDQIEADTFALKYTDPDSLLNILEKADKILAEVNETTYRKRVGAIKAFRQSPPSQEK